MKDIFIGKWNYNNKQIEILKENHTFTTFFKRPSLGISFKDSIIFSEFDENVQVAGIGVYSPVGDGNSLYALWSSIKISGSLGSGIALKSDNTSNLTGEYFVRYFVKNTEVNSFNVKIDKTNNEEVYNLSWFINNQKVLHGIGIMIDNSLVFSWGSTNCLFDLHLFDLEENNNDKLKLKTVKWNDPKPYVYNLLRKKG